LNLSLLLINKERRKQVTFVKSLTKSRKMPASSITMEKTLGTRTSWKKDNKKMETGNLKLLKIGQQ